MTDFPARGSQPFIITHRLADDLDKLFSHREVVSVGVIDETGQIIEVMRGMTERVGNVLQAAHLSFLPEGQWPCRHGFLVDDREFATGNRVFDVYVPTDFASTLEAVTHPSISSIRLDIQELMDVVIDCRKGNFPKAIAEVDAEVFSVVLPDDDVEMMAEEVLREKLELIDGEFDLDDECNFTLDGDKLIAAWDLGQNFGISPIFSADSGRQIDRLDFRNQWLFPLGSALFEGKFAGDVPDRACKILVRALRGGVLKGLRYWDLSAIFYFRYAKNGNLEICLNFELGEYVGPPDGPDDGEEVPLLNTG